MRNDLTDFFLIKSLNKHTSNRYVFCMECRESLVGYGYIDRNLYNLGYFSNSVVGGTCCSSFWWWLDKELMNWIRSLCRYWQSRGLQNKSMVDWNTLVRWCACGILVIYFTQFHIEPCSVEWWLVWRVHRFTIQ